MNANNSVCCDNVLSYNGMDINHDLRSDLSASSSEFITFSNNSIISTSNALYSVYFDNCKSIIFNGNSVKDVSITSSTLGGNNANISNIIDYKGKLIVSVLTWATTGLGGFYVVDAK